LPAAALTLQMMEASARFHVRPGGATVVRQKTFAIELPHKAAIASQQRISF
jgi:hypothetical protein